MEFAFSDRLKRLPPYPFADLRRKIAAAREKGVKVISLGIGDPDQPTPDEVVKELIRTVADPADANRHRYGCDVPVAQYARSVRDFYTRRYGVTLGEDQVVTTSGSKDAIAQLPTAVMNAGDIGIATTPGYPTYNIGHIFSGANTYFLPLDAKNDFLPGLDSIPSDALRVARVLWINYPNNPTTAVAPMDFFRRAVEFGRKHRIIIAHDSAYSENTYDGYKAPSILQVDGADDTAVEFFSLSKAFNMTGWRAGALVGNASVVKALRTVKENIDNGVLRGIQFAAAKALDMAEKLTPAVNAIYQRRRDMVVEALNANGWRIAKPRATIYIWAPVPEKYARMEKPALAFATDLLEKAGVAVTPGPAFGEKGEGFFRISLSYPDDILKQAMDRIFEMKK
ncbi:MAG: aminotransferase class I/II-fold pyridoxal phosphate-dependent enzyme [Planctomycetes bacterium]|nr:aminotransferase class I/II-fold pyridoxal phosphate-dependent enzyme [Planctomycetota bacterium]